MKSHVTSTTFATFLMALLIIPQVFFIIPNTVYAQGLGVPVAESGLVGWDSMVNTIKSTFNLISTITNTAANVAQQINTYVLQPLAFIMSGHLLKVLTAGVIDFVIGAANGTGAPQFVQNLQGNLQRVGDIQANAFFMQFGNNSNSPFRGAITSSLSTNYFWNTSSDGFFRANKYTMARYSPNPNAFLAGNWSQGGVGAWFALTTQTQNNPYTFYQASQSHLASIVGGATAARLAELNWGQGMLSWCGANDTTAPAGAQTQIFDDGSTLTTDNAGNMTATNAVGINPGDPCLDKDGTPGTIMTPGSTIKASLDKVLGAEQDRLVQIGQLAKEVGSILKNVGTVFSTINFASQILGGIGSGGLFGMGQKSGTNTNTRLWELQNTPTLGVSSSTVIQNAATIPALSSDTSGRLSQYESSWSTIRSSAVAATASLNSLANFCDNAATTAKYGGQFPSVARAQAVAARSAINTQVSPIITQADATIPVVAATRVVLARTQGGQSGSAEYLADLQTLQSMPPSESDISNAMQEAQAFSSATAIPSGSLNASGGTMVGRMNLISTNAEALKTSVCVEPIPEEVQQSGGSGGGGTNDG
jgi:hypothetical protein